MIAGPPSYGAPPSNTPVPLDARYKGVLGHGFVALAAAKDKASAAKLFKAIDGNGGGVVLLDEWCSYIKAAEVAQGTALGKLLALDEVPPPLSSSHLISTLSPSPPPTSDPWHSFFPLF